MGGSKRDYAYLKGTKGMRICFGSKEACVDAGYTDADYAGDMDKRRSTSGYVFMFTGGVVSWRSRLQNCVSMSNTEAEYIAAQQKHARKHYALLV